MSVNFSTQASISTLLLSGIIFNGYAQDTPPPSSRTVEYSPYPDKTFPNNVYFGDTHLHTSYSTDAGMVGNIRGPADGYRLARGEVITSSHGLKVQLNRPSDFLVISDHAENLGLAPAIAVSDPVLLKNKWGKEIHDKVKLWEWMEDIEEKTGGRMLAIPHNGNISNGLMFDDVTLYAKTPLDLDYAQTRMRWEPLYEITQIKGDSEAHPALSPNDEFADFYTWDTRTLGPESATPEMWPRSYAREALKRGLVYEESLGANPFKFGVVGGTDSHTSIASTEEDNFFGKVSLVEPSAAPLRFDEIIVARSNPDKSKQIRHWRAAASGLTAVWSRENTRTALWDSMTRKEVYATTGTRLRVRVFAGWDYGASDLARSDFAEYSYEHGVPMGGDLTAAPRNKAPTLPEGADPIHQERAYTSPIWYTPKTMT